MPTVTRKLTKLFFSVWQNHVIFNGKGRHACKYRATKYRSLLFICVGGGGVGGGGVGAAALQTEHFCDNSGNVLIIFRASTERKINCNDVAQRNQ